MTTSGTSIHPFGWTTGKMTRVAGGLIMLLGLWTWMVVAMQSKDAARHANWVPAQATVESSRIRSTILKGTAREYFADVTYFYEVAGSTQRDTRAVVVGRIDSLQDQSRRFDKVYYKGRQLEIFHDPSNPHESTLQKSSLDDLWKGALGGLAALAIGIGLWRFAPHQED